MLKWMIEQGYQDERTMRRRIENMEKFIADKTPLLEADSNAKYYI